MFQSISHSVKLSFEDLWLNFISMNAVLKDIFENVFFAAFRFYSECIRKRQITQLIIYFAVSNLATKHKSGVAECDCGTCSLPTTWNVLMWYQELVTAWRHKIITFCTKKTSFWRHGDYSFGSQIDVIVTICVTWAVFLSRDPHIAVQ